MSFKDCFGYLQSAFMACVKTATLIRSTWPCLFGHTNKTSSFMTKNVATMGNSGKQQHLK